MADPNRKQAESKTSRASRRGGVLRRGGRRKEGEASAREKREADQNEKVSPLLESTSQASEEVKQLLEAADDASKKIREAARTEASGKPGGRSVEGNETTALIGKINKEVQGVLESADEAAEKIREEAHAEARRLIDETRRRAESVTTEQMDRVSGMTDQVLGELTAVQEQLETLRSAFDRSIRTMSVDLGIEQSEVWETQQNGAPGVEESSDLRSRLGRRHQRKGAAEPDGISEGARLLALQQHMAGVDAEVIEQRLSEQFGIEDPRPILEWMGIQAPPPKPSQKPKKR